MAKNGLKKTSKKQVLKVGGMKNKRPYSAPKRPGRRPSASPSAPSNPFHPN